MKRILFVFGMIGIVIISCSKSSEKTDGSNPGGGTTTIDCTGVAATFSADVNPIIQTNCATNSGCHGAGSSNGPGPLLTFAQISNNKAAIRSAVLSGAMPLGGSLSTAQKNTIACWIDHGAVSD